MAITLLIHLTLTFDLDGYFTSGFRKEIWLNVSFVEFPMEVKGKSVPYSIMSVGHRGDSSFLAVSPQAT